MPTTPDPAPFKPNRQRVAIVGGGAAGFFTAINAAEKNPDLEITIFEAGHQPLQKVRISGGGRCNLTHHCFEPARLVEFYPRGQRELKSLFARFQPKDTVAWFRERGLKVKTESDGRIFPVTDDSQSVIELFQTLARRLNIQLRTQSRVTAIQKSGDLFTITVGGKSQSFEVCVITTGYSPTGWQIIQSLGHPILPAVPSLFPLTIKNPVLTGLQGIALTEARGKLIVSDAGKPNTFNAEGPVLITHTGLSGPLIYRLSAWGARALSESRYQAKLVLDCLPSTSEEALRNRLYQLFNGFEGKKNVGNLSLEPFPGRLWQAFLTASGISLEAKAETVGKKALPRLAETIKRLPLDVTGKSPSKEEFVSCGGVSLKTVDFKTLESKQVNGLFFAGETLDIDGLTGGFNFQACWSGGWVVSEALKTL